MSCKSEHRWFSTFINVELLFILFNFILCCGVGKKRLFIVAVSANSDPDIAQGAIDAGFDGFIEKPFTIKSLQKVK